MLKQASVAQIRSGEVSRDDGHIVVAMCRYPRGLRRELRDEYCHELAPDPALFARWLRAARHTGHDTAFRLSRYEERFSLSARALDRLGRLSLLAHERDVYLVCQCALGDRCHRELLLVLAREELGAHVGRIYHHYPAFRRRLKGLLLRAA